MILGIFVNNLDKGFEKFMVHIIIKDGRIGGGHEQGGPAFLGLTGKVSRVRKDTPDVLEIILEAGKRERAVTIQSCKIDISSAFEQETEDSYVIAQDRLDEGCFSVGTPHINVRPAGNRSPYRFECIGVDRFHQPGIRGC
jgi:hypothetical protein